MLAKTRETRMNFADFLRNCNFRFPHRLDHSRMAHRAAVPEHPDQKKYCIRLTQFYRGVKGTVSRDGFGF
jgi:hypothetical protein